MERSKPTEKKGLTILIVSNEFPPGPGGIGTHAYSLASKLSHAHQVTVVCSQRYSDVDSVERFNKTLTFDLIPLRPGVGFFSKAVTRIRTVQNALRLLRPDVVLPTGSDSIWICTLLKHFYSFRQVVIAHGGELNFQSTWRRKLTLWGCKRSDHVISVSEYTAGFLYRNDIARSRVTVIPNGADKDIFRSLGSSADLKQKYGWSGNQVILTVGSISERKGQDVVIKAMPSVLKDFPKAIYVMAGRCEDQSPYLRLAREAGVLSNLVFFGIASNQQLAELYNLSDVFILASRHSRSGDFEGFGIAVIEAALCGLASVVTSGSGLTEAIVDGTTGIAVPPDNVGETASAIIRLLKDDHFRRQLARAAQERARKDFTWDFAAAKYGEVLDSIQKAR